MAKGDKNKVQNMNQEGLGYATNNLTNTQNVVNRQNLGFEQNYEGGVNRNLNDYDSIMNQYRSYLSGGPMGGSQQYGNNQQQQGGNQQGGAAAFIKQYQASHPASEGKAGILKALQDNGFNASDYKYGDVSSGNEINLAGEKYKVLGGENSSNPFWYEAGTDDSAPGSRGGMMNPLLGYSNFAQTGGFSPEDIQNIRARSVAPIRGLYSGLMNEVGRQRKLQGGFSPNATAALAKMGRDKAYAMSDQTTNTEAGIAQLMQQGKLAGLGGLQQGTLAGMSGQNSLYGSTPGLAGTFGNQVLGSTGQILQTNQLANDITRMRMGGAANAAQVPGNFTQAMGNIASILGLIGQGAGAVSGLGGLGGRANPMLEQGGGG